VPPDGDGTYVAAAASGEEIAANTWDGRRVMIDAETGRIRSVSLVK